MLEIGSDVKVTFNDLTDLDTDEIISDATMSARLLLAEDRSEVSTFAMTARGDGKYTGLIANAVTKNLQDQESYIIEFTIDSEGKKRLPDHIEIAGHGQL